MQTIPTRLTKVNNALLVKLRPREGVDFGEIPTTMALVLDNSGSMGGDPQREVVRTLAAISPRLRPSTLVAGVVFGSKSRVFHALSGDHATLGTWGAHDKYIREAGVSGSTNMAAAITDAADQLQRGGAGRLRRMLILTDGYPDSKDAALAAARQAASQGINITPLGFGEYDDRFMNDIAALSSDTMWDMRDARETMHLMVDRILATQDEVTQNMVLEIEFLGKHSVLDMFTVHPNTVYNGPLRMGEDRIWRMPLQPLQREKGLELLINLSHPQLSAGRKTVARVSVCYDIPSLGIREQKQTQEVWVDYTDAQEIITAMDSEVDARVADAFVERQRLRAEQALKDGNPDLAVALIGTIKKTAADPAVKALAAGTVKKIQAGTYTAVEARRLATGTQKKDLATRSETS